MALWSNTDAVPGLATARYTVGTSVADNGTMTVTAVGSSFGIDTCAQVGDVIRFGADDRGATGAGHTYFGDAVIVAVASSSSCTIGSTDGLSAVGFTTSARFSRLPKSTVLDSSLGVNADSSVDNVVYGISTTSTSTYSIPHQGWVGVTTYIDNHGTLRVKSEVLVAMSGISTDLDVVSGTPSISFPTDKGRS